MNISNNISSITASQTMLNNSANNVANVNTDKFIPNSTVMGEKSDSVTAYTRKADDSGSQKSQTDLSKEFPDQIVAEKTVSANVSTIRAQDEMFGSLLDIKA